MSELKAFTFGLGQYTEDGSPCVVAFDGEKNPRLASDEKFYLKSEVDAAIAELKRENERLVKCCKEYDSRQRISGGVQMSELKAYRPRELVMQGRHNEPIYLKSEADKAIEELEESHKMEVEQLLLEIVELKKKLTAAQQAQPDVRTQTLGGESSEGGKMKTLTLSLKKQWFDMIKAGIKKEDYREQREYWIKRYPKADDTERRLTFKNPKIRIGTGRPEWGAEPGKMYFVISWEE